ncbi:sulfatase [Pelagicoccus mobilis]|uniref:Sulfatase n=1 Tax=Pelagicoccus mobilis TaxID=415221 RepID=A0A934S2D5_9BACT|nr:sulfatase [Pelagicoccus mobilis]MBK1877803.1 sulfatase [Pelagicoccus mobilis]
MKTILRLACATVVATTLKLACAAPSDSPNVLIIAVDDLKPLIGAYQDSHAITPAIDKLASRGTVFRNAYCQQAVCGASRASFFTGQRPDSVQVWDFKSRMRDHQPDLITLPQHFKNHGYHTASVGKVFDPRCSDGKKNDARSWSQPHTSVETPHLLINHFGARDALSKIKSFRLKAPPEKKDNSDLNSFKLITERLENDVPDDFYGDGLRANWAVSFLEEQKQNEKPFFLVVGFKKPHLPFIAPKKYWDLHDPDKLPLAAVTDMPVGSPDFHYQDSWELRGGYGGIPEGKLPEEMQRELVHGYYACVSYIDAQIARILETLEEQGLAENTIVALWGDHGWHLGDHGMWCKHTNYEQATRVPFIVVPPESFGPATPQTTTPVDSIDLAPTLTELCNIPALASFAGKSLTPLLADSEAIHKPFAVSQFHRHTEGNTVMGYAFRNKRYRLITWIEMDFKAGERSGPLVATELYDLQKDPDETKNLASLAEFTDLSERLTRRAARYAKQELGVSWSQ